MNLTARHFQPAAGTGSATQNQKGTHFSCADCHRGTGWQGRSAVLWESAYNTYKYALLHFEEPDKLAFPLPNATCATCHPGVQGEGEPSRFHGIKAHKDQKTVFCIECHLSHASSKDRKKHLTSMLGAMTTTCRRCHKGEELSPPVAGMLDGIRKVETTRLNLGE